MNRIKISMAMMVILTLVKYSKAFLDPGKISFNVTERSCHYFQVHRSMLKDTVVSFKVQCDPSVKDKDTKVKIGWVVRSSPCFEEYLGPEVTEPEFLSFYYDCPLRQMGDFGYKSVTYLKRGEIELKCDHLINTGLITGDEGFKEENVSTDLRCLTPERSKICSSSPAPPFSLAHFSADGMNMDKPVVSLDQEFNNLRRKRESDVGIIRPKPASSNVSTNASKDNPDHHIKVPSDGVYLIVLKITSPVDGKLFDASVDIDIKGTYGYLSAIEYPLLHFYGIMCIFYLVMALIWFIVSALQWRDLLRIQFWIGAVILIGMIEKAVFYAEHSSLNSTGVSAKETIMIAEVISCFKRTLARMLVIVVSLGFGIVKPRLGTMFHRVVIVGSLYYLLGVIEASLRIYRPKNDPANQAMMAGIPLAVLDSIICWWVFSSLVQTTRTLRMRRNLVKLNLYRQFTNTLVIAVLASIAFMGWQIHYHKLTNCLTDWENLWLDEAYWHLLFSIVLLIIMILWRPTNNNQRYAFSPLLDSLEDGEDMEPFISSFDPMGGMKMRQMSESSDSHQKDGLLDKQTMDDLKWVEDNLKTTLVDSALPVLMDSDEEILTAKFERNKME